MKQFGLNKFWMIKLCRKVLHFQEVWQLALDKNGKLLIIDGHSLAHRAYHAVPGTLTRSDGTPINAVLGFCNMLMRLVEQEKPDKAVCTFDMASPTFRHLSYEDYKNNRKPMDEDLKVQIPILHEAAEAFGFCVMEMDGYEADDVIGTVAKKADEEGYEVLIVTGDKDSLQLVSTRVNVVLTRKGISEFEKYDLEKVNSVYGFGPELVPDLKGLMGDQSDNIPGVKGIGEKTALKLIQEFGPIEKVFENLDIISSKRTKELLENGKDSAFESKELATIDTNVPIDIDFSGMGKIDIYGERMESFLIRQDFKKLLSAIKGRESGNAATVSKTGQNAYIKGDIGEFGRQTGIADNSTTQLRMVTKPDVKLINSLEELKKCTDSLLKEPRIAFDVISDVRSSSMTAEILGFGIKGDNIFVYIPIYNEKTQNCVMEVSLLDDGHDLEDEKIKGLKLCDVLDYLKPVFENDITVKLCHDVKFKRVLLKKNGVEINGSVFDSMIAAYLADPLDKNLELADVVAKWLNCLVPSVNDILNCRMNDYPGKRPGKRSENMELDHNKIRKMMGARLSCIYDLEPVLTATMESIGVSKLYNEVEIPLTSVLAEMEMTGVKVDVNRLSELSHSLGERQNKLLDEIYSIAGEQFNVNSTKQLASVLFDKLGLKPTKKTKTGYSTDSEVLEALSDQHIIVEKILEYRTVAKLKSTYVDALPMLVNKDTNRIHTTFNQTITATGRLSSTNPNLQNIPIRSEEGSKIREVFVSRGDGWVIMSADYSQIELRVLADMSKDRVLTESFKADEDVHTRTAAEVYNVNFSEVTPEMRSNSKSVNFGIVYGISDFGLSKNIGVSIQEAKLFIKNYFEVYSGVKMYMDSAVRQAKEDGYVKTIMNRRRQMPELFSRNAVVRKFGERIAMNAPIQGSAADIMKCAMISVDRKIKDMGLKSCILLQVHDELVLDVPNEEVNKVKKLVKEEMENTVKLSVPLRVDVKWGKYWCH